jgi:hypothetical protein
MRRAIGRNAARRVRSRNPPSLAEGHCRKAKPAAPGKSYSACPRRRRPASDTDKLSTACRHSRPPLKPRPVPPQLFSLSTLCALPLFAAAHHGQSRASDQAKCLVESCASPIYFEMSHPRETDWPLRLRPRGFGQPRRSASLTVASPLTDPRVPNATRSPSAGDLCRRFSTDQNLARRKEGYGLETSRLEGSLRQRPLMCARYTIFIL